MVCVGSRQGEGRYIDGRRMQWATSRLASLCRGWNSGGGLSALMLAAATLIASSWDAGAGNRPRLYTHQSYIEDITNDTVLPLSDPKAMLTFVLESLPDRVKVYPTENYYYFHFYSQGVRYAGNLRLDMMDRDKGKLHFAYFEDLQEWKADAPLTYNVFDQADGVLVEKIDYLVYRVTFAERQVVFELNDLSKVVPPAHVVGPDEKYLGPVFDEFRHAVLPNIQFEAEAVPLHSG